MVPVAKVRPYFIEGVSRVGFIEFCRRTGLADRTVTNALRGLANGRPYSVQKRIVRKVMLEVISMRRKNEVRHRDSIRHGAKQRGREEKVPSARRDFYRPQGDDENEARKRHRRAAA